jgi:GMC oxidoreductase
LAFLAGRDRADRKTGRRWSAAREFLKPTIVASNLKVEIHTQEGRILFDGQRAIGVEMLKNGARQKIRECRARPSQEGRGANLVMEHRGRRSGTLVDILKPNDVIFFEISA